MPRVEAEDHCSSGALGISLPPWESLPLRLTVSFLSTPEDFDYLHMSHNPASNLEKLKIVGVLCSSEIVTQSRG